MSYNSNNALLSIIHISEAFIICILCPNSTDFILYTSHAVILKTIYLLFIFISQLLSSGGHQDGFIIIMNCILLHLQSVFESL